MQQPREEKGLQGSERGKFMNACLDGNDKPASTSVRQQRHDECNAIARERRLDGAERRGYTTECEKPPAVKNASSRDTPRDCEARADGRRLEGDDRRAYVKGCLDAAREADTRLTARRFFGRRALRRASRRSHRHGSR